MPRKVRLMAAKEQAEEILARESDQPLALNLLGYVLYSLEGATAPRPGRSSPAWSTWPAGRPTIRTGPTGRRATRRSASTSLA